VTGPHPDNQRDGRSEQIRLHAEALCRCIWSQDHDRAEECDYHRRELDRLEHGA
jgi:hypothetical protein